MFSLRSCKSVWGRIKVYKIVQWNWIQTKTFIPVILAKKGVTGIKVYSLA